LKIREDVNFDTARDLGNLDDCTAVASGTVGTVPTVPLFVAGTANCTTIWTKK